MAVTLNANSSTGFIATSDTSSILQLQTGGTTAISIDASQNVNFPVTGQRITGDFSNATVANRVAIQSSTVNGNTEVFAIPNGTGALAAFRLSNTSDITNNSGISMVATTTEARLAASNAGTGTYLPMTFFTGGSESLRLSATTKAVILAGGSTSANGTGITFPATQSASTDANTLDDYEEGTFTATITGMGSATNNNVTARYIKIGRVVTLYFPYTAYTTNAGSGASDVAIALPFPASSAISSSAALGLQSGGSANAGTHTNIYFSAGGSTALFYYDNATSWVRVTGSLLASTWTWAGNVVYLTDS